MDPLTAHAEAVFYQALELPSGDARNRFVSDQCARDPGLRQEVESLLQAHDQAGGFLQTEQATTKASAKAGSGAPDRPSIPPQSPASGDAAAATNAAAQAATYLRDATTRTGKPLQVFVATLPESIRKEAGERIEAGLRARSLAVASPTPPRTSEPVREVPGFRIERPIGEGGLGVVYAAHDEKLDRRVAIKILRRGGEEQVRRRVLDEARKAAALNDPAIVTIYSVLDESDPPAIVMELVEGYPLDRFAAQLNFEQKARLLREVARGLAAAHDHGLVHRDLKPDNIIVGPDLRPRILDFGLALPLEEAARSGGGFEGTPLYAAPEQALGRPLTAAADVFSFGSLMFKVLTGRAPFAGQTPGEVLEAIATTSPPFLREVALGIPEDLQAICLACLAWNPADRPTASELAVDLGRFLVGEPVRLKPKLYGDLLRQSVSAYSSQARGWESQSIITREEHDALEIVHRRLLADEDHWIIDARRITFFQTILSGATWLAVVATILTVWMLRGELGPVWRWVLPAFFTGALFAAGRVAQRGRETLPAATFLAGAALATAPCVLALLAELGLFARPASGVTQLFGGMFSNQQVLVASLAALAVSALCWRRLKMTAFAWTTAALVTTSHVSVLLLFNWLDQKPEIQALWCLPLIALEPAALALERRGRVRWTMPFHLVALLVLVAGLDVIAIHGPTLKMLGVDGTRWPFFDSCRMSAFSFVLNGLLFLALMLVTERAASLDLRRAGKLMEILAIVHTLSALFVNATSHRQDAHLRADVWLYLAAAVLFLVLAPFRSRWRMLVGGLVGCGLGCYLLVDLGLVARKPFIISLGFAGLLIALGSFAFVRRRAADPGRRHSRRLP
jgi:serine/threonine protein kinase